MRSNGRCADTPYKNKQSINGQFESATSHQRQGTMVYKVKGKFVLDIHNVQRIVDDILKQPKNKDVEITVKKSDNENSKSVYLFLYIEGATTCLRISDHKCRGEVRQLLVCGSTGKSNVYYKIERVIDDLRYKSLCRALGR